MVSISLRFSLDLTRICVMYVSMKHFIFLPALMLCAACGGNTVQKTLGYERTAPDEFRVVSRPPLTVPKEFYLYPPDEAARRQSPTATKDARSVLLEESQTAYKYKEDSVSDYDVDSSVPVVQSSALPSGAEESLLSKIGAQNADGSIRKTLSQEAELQEDKSLLDKIRTPEEEEIVNAEKERERILEAQKNEQPIDGQGAETVDTKKSTLDWIFE